MGAGKSFWGPRLARLLDYPFFDLDKVLEERAGMSIPEIFERGGEALFREMEAEALLEILSQTGPYVLAVGGGTPCFFDNADRLNAATHAIYLQTPVALLSQRLSAEASQRPLLRDWPPDRLEEGIRGLLASREPFYLKAQVILPVSADFPPDETVFLAWAKARFDC